LFRWVSQGRFSVPRLSIIIPVLGSAARLETTLVSVLEHRPQDCEVIVVLDAAYDDPYELSGEVRFIEAQGANGFAQSVNAGIQASRAETVNVLAAGVEVCECWADAALAHFLDPRVAAVSPLIHDTFDRRMILAAGIDYSPRRGRQVQRLGDNNQKGDILGPLAQAGFYRRAALELVGHFPTTVGDLHTDVDLALTLRYAGYRAVLEPRSVVQATAGDLLLAPNHGWRFGLNAERLFWRTAGTLGWSNALAGHALGAMSEFARNLPRLSAATTLAGRLIGACSLGRHRAHRQWLLDVRRASQSLLRASKSPHLRVDSAHPSPRTGALLPTASPAPVS
jgi:Glycosyl transferase family 2